MAHHELKPNYSSSDDDEEEEEDATASEDEQPSGSESEDLSDSASDQKPKPDPKKTLISPSNPKSAVKPQAPDICSSESEESDSDTDSDSPPPKSVTAATAAAAVAAVVDPNIKPISSVPMESKLIKKSPVRIKRPAVTPATAANENNNNKKAKSIAAAVDDDSKKQLFQRLWSEDDEIVILKGMIDYKAESGENLINDMGAFHEFIKKSLHVDVSRAQLADKIRRLKKKYVNNVSREKDGKDRSFNKSHEQRGYELSKLIWGIEGKKSVLKNKGNGLEDREVVGVVELGERSMDISRFVKYGGRNESPVLEEEIVKGGMELVEGEKRVELEEKWRSLKKEELEIYLKKMDLIKEQVLVVLEAVNSSGN